MTAKRTYKVDYNSTYKDTIESMLWSEKPVLFVKFETSGLDPMRDKVIKISVTKTHFEDRHLIKDDEFMSLVNSEIEISDTIKQITGINQEDLDKADDIISVMTKVYDFIGPEANLIGYNMNKFVIPFLKNAGFYSGQMIDIKNVVDLEEMATHLLEPTKDFKKYSYINVISYLNIKNDNIMDSFIEMFNLLSDRIPSGINEAIINKKSLWQKSYTCRYIFVETNFGKVSFNCSTGFWVENIPGFFDTVNMDKLQKDTKISEFLKEQQK